MNDTGLGYVPNKEEKSVLPGPIFVGMLSEHSPSVESATDIRVLQATCTILIPPFRSLSEALKALSFLIKDLC